MRINNVSAKTSKMVVVLLAIFAIIVTVGFTWAYFNTAISEHSIASFFKWYEETLNHLIADNKDEPIIPYLVMIIVPLLAYGGLVASIVSRHFALKAMESTLNLKFVDFLQDRVKFNFNRPQYNFICGYNDISNLEMILKTVMVHNKYGSYPAVSEINLNFSVLNNKHFTLTNVPLKLTNFIYKIIDYGRAVRSFSYRFEGAGSVESIEEKIRDYTNTGCKQILAKQQETNFKWLSITFFAFSMFFLFTFRQSFNTLDVMFWSFALIPIVGFLVISFVFDIILLADKWNENKYKGLGK